MSRALTVLLAAAALAVAAAAGAAGPAETTAEVPALGALHEVIYPLWHQAWPGKDATELKALLPDAEAGVSALAAAELPGILRDRRAAWDQGVAALRDAVGAYRRAADRDDTQGMLDAVETLHSRYETLVRLVRPPLEALEAYHVVLYGLVHHRPPVADRTALRGAAETLVARCAPLAAATLPRRLADRQERFTTAAAELCSRTATLRRTVAEGSEEAVAAAVDAVHEQYQHIDTLLQ